jgi:predicted Zn-dependent protease with MMP-like domain
MRLDVFRKLVREALDSIPAAFRKKMGNIAVVVEDWPSEEVLEDFGIDDPTELLGLYQGVPLDQREATFANVLPDHIVIYRRPIEAHSQDPVEVRAVVRETVIHEVGHFFGLSDDEIEEIISS